MAFARKVYAALAVQVMVELFGCISSGDSIADTQVASYFDEAADVYIKVILSLLPENEALHIFTSLMFDLLLQALLLVAAGTTYHTISSKTEWGCSGGPFLYQ